MTSFGSCIVATDSDAIIVPKVLSCTSWFFHRRPLILKSEGKSQMQKFCRPVFANKSRVADDNIYTKQVGKEWRFVLMQGHNVFASVRVSHSFSVR